MGNFFPRWTNFLPLKLIVAGAVLATGAVAAITVYWTPKYSRMGYQPEQPIPFDHSLHSGQLKMDCRYCHTHVEDSLHSNLPTAQTCWTCHQFVKSDSPKLAPLREAMAEGTDEYTGDPIKWVQIHKTPDYAYFSHQAHVNRGVSCVECHGKVNEMEVVWHDKSLSMSFCLDCHRNPEKALRPLDQITNLDWEAADQDRDAFYAYLTENTGRTPEELLGIAKSHGLVPEGEMTQKEIGLQLREAWGVQPPESCTACHR